MQCCWSPSQHGEQIVLYSNWLRKLNSRSLKVIINIKVKCWSFFSKQIQQLRPLGDKHDPPRCCSAMVCGTSWADHRNEATGEWAVGETESGESKKAKPLMIINKTSNGSIFNRVQFQSRFTECSSLPVLFAWSVHISLRVLPSLLFTRWSSSTTGVSCTGGTLSPVRESCAAAIWPETTSSARHAALAFRPDPEGAAPLILCLKNVHDCTTWSLSVTRCEMYWCVATCSRDQDQMVVIKV